MPGIRPLETLHNSLSLRQLDSFLGYVTSANFKAPHPEVPPRSLRLHGPQAPLTFKSSSSDNGNPTGNRFPF